jgi:hypothetical protein
MSNRLFATGRRPRRWPASAASALSWADRYTLWAFNPARPMVRGARPPSHRPCTGSEDASPAEAKSAPELVSQLVAEERERASSWQDPVRTLRELDVLATHLSSSVADLRSDLPQAVRTLRRRGWSFEQIATRSGLTVTRVIELARESRARGL